MTKENLESCFKRDSSGKIIFEPVDESQAKFLFIQIKDRLSFLREEIASYEENIDSLLGLSEEDKKIKRVQQSIRVELLKRQLGIERDKYSSIRQWFTQNNIIEPDPLWEKFEKKQRDKILDIYIERVRKREKIIIPSKDKIKDKTQEKLIKGEKSKKWTYEDDFELCELLSNNKYVPTPEEESRKKNKTFLSNRTKWWDRPGRKYRDKFVNIIEELESQTQMEVTKFSEILIIKSDYHREALLNAFKYAVNHPDGNLYEKANKKKVSIKNTRKGKILLLN